MRAMTLLDNSGDTTIVWDEDTDEKMLGIIEKKLKEGFVFYIVKEVPLLKVQRLVKSKSMAAIRKAGSVVIKDEELEKLFLGGEIGTTTVPANDINTVRKAGNANDVVQNHSVAVRPQRGG